MDYRRPVEALIPGVQGRVLGVLSRTSTELTMRTVAQLAGVSAQQASVVIGRLVDLGVVERRDVPPASLVRLVADNLAAQAVASVADLRSAALEHLSALAADITPAPASLVVFGSFARGDAGPDSDVDVLAVRPPALRYGADDDWVDSLGRWADQATRAIGNPVNLVEVEAAELPGLLARPAPSVWHDATRDGVVVAGSPLTEMAGAA
ncbi:MAG: nucleotidyltransferase domain-containing protein [Acidimicrobiales bacterium]